MSFTRKWCIIRIMEQLRDLRSQLSDDHQNPDRKAWRATWNSTIDLARALGVFDMIPARILSLQK